MRNWRNLRAWMDSIIRYQIKRENLLEKLNFLKLSARLRKTFISTLKIQRSFSSNLKFVFVFDFLRMGKYLDLKKKKWKIDFYLILIRILIGKKNCFNTIFNRVDFPVNFDLNLTEEERRYNNKRYQDNF